MRAFRWLSILLPAGLAAAALLLIVRVSPDRDLLFPEDLDVLLTSILMLIALFLAILILIRERMRQWIEFSVEQARAEAIAEHRRFMRRLDHELKNPLMILRGGLSTLAITVTAEHEHHLIDTMTDTLKRLSDLVANLRKLADLDVLSLAYGRIDLHQLVTEAADLLRANPTLADRSFSQEIAIPEPAPDFQGDYDLLLIALYNLLDNALKYTGSGDAITLSGTLSRAGVVLQVSDTGIGIPTAELNLVCEELYRGRASMGNVAGTGIGLSLSQAIVEAHQGVIHLESEEGHGTLVTISLPLRPLSVT